MPYTADHIIGVARRSVLGSPVQWVECQDIREGIRDIHE